jgi:hypothetical protein
VTRQDDPARYVGFDGKRLRWVEDAIAITEKWIEEAGSSADTEIMFGRPGDFDWDAATDTKSEIKNARETLAKLEAEREAILSRQALLQRDADAGKYDDDYS